jgi:diguanylate cyclase (GGDEF)-like protein
MLAHFPDDRRRALLLMGLVAAASSLNFLIELYAYLHGASTFAALIPAVAVIVFPIVGLLIILRLPTPRLLETFIVGAIAIGMMIRMAMVTLHPHVSEMGPAMMIGIVFVIYLYLPIRFVGAMALAIGFSVLAPLWWRASLGPALPPDQFFRTIVWLLLANALGFVAANSLQRSLRMQFAQRLILQQLLSTDSLTGIANRRRFDDALEREWRRCRRAGTAVSLLMIDVDHFKPYNDLFGHQQGDICLRQVARLLLDEVGRPADLLARYGGEEFVCLLPEAGPFGARTVANRLIAAIQHADIAHPLSPTGGRLTISIGVATATDLAGAPDALVALADKLLYAAKDAGRDQVMAGTLPRRTPTPVAA